MKRFFLVMLLLIGMCAGTEKAAAAGVDGTTILSSVIGVVLGVLGVSAVDVVVNSPKTLVVNNPQNVIVNKCPTPAPSPSSTPGQ